MSLRHLLSLLTAAALLAVVACNTAGTSGMPALGVPNPVAGAELLGNRAHQAQYTFTDYAIPTAKSYPNRIVTGPDGALWFTEEGYKASKIGRITTDGTFTEYPLLGGFEPSHIASAYGNIWFTSNYANDIGFVTPGGQLTYYAAQSTTRGITAGAGDGRVWFTEFEAGNVAVVDAATGAITQYTVPSLSSEPYDVVYRRKAGLLWFTEFDGKKIGSVTGSGAFKEYKTPSKPQGLVFGPDGALWFTEPIASKIGRMTTSGKIQEYSTPTAGAGPDVITAGPDGALWFTEFSVSKIGRITTGGAITETDTPDANAQPVGITTGPDKDIWFVEHATNAIVKLAL